MFGKVGKAANVAYIIFVIVGIGLIIGSIVSGLRGNTELQGTLPVEATVSRVDNTWNGINSSDTVYVTYTVNGVEYESALDYAPLGAQAGEQLKAFYYEEDPSRITTATSTTALYLVLGGLGLVFLLLGIIPYMRNRRRKQEMDYLNDNGDVIQAEVISVMRDNRRTSISRTPYIICCRYKDPNGVYHQFKSHEVWFDPTSLVMGHTLDVVVDPNDMSHYYVDITEIEENENYQ